MEPRSPSGHRYIKADLAKACSPYYVQGRRKSCVAFVAIGLLLVGGGLVVGLVLRRIDLGIAISSLFAAILSIIEVSLAWFQAS